jgi:hypothetical protein
VDGKVCLSLLGVTESSNNSQRWHKDESSLAQVLLSIQTQIFGVAEPYYNEGNGVSLALRDTREGNAGSRNYNRTIRLGTLRHAMIDMLRQPPVGFEDVVHRHFALCRQRVALQCQRWTLEEAVEAQRSRRREDELVHAKFQQVQADLLSLLVANPANGTYPSLAPLESDIQHVTRLDPQSAARLLRTSSTKLDKDDANNQKVSAAANMLMRDARLLALLQQQQRLEQQVAYNPSNPSNYNSQQQLDADGLLALQLQQEQRDSDRRHTEQERRQREREQRLVALQRQQAQAEPEDQPPEQQRPATEQQEPMSDAAPFNPWATTTSESTLPSSLTPTTSTSENQATANAEHGGSSAAGYTSDGDLYE